MATKEPTKEEPKNVSAKQEKLTPPLLIINSVKIELTKKVVKHYEIQHVLPINYRSNNAFTGWLSRTPQEWFHANHDGVDYYLDSRSSLTVNLENLRGYEELGFCDDKSDFGDIKPDKGKLYLTNSEITLENPPTGGNLVDGYQGSIDRLKDSVLIRTKVWDRLNTHGCGFKNVTMVDSIARQVAIRDSFLINSEAGSNSLDNRGELYEVRLYDSKLIFNHSLFTNKATLKSVDIKAENIKIRFNDISCMLVNKELKTKEDVLLDDAFQIGNLLEHSGVFGGNVTYYKSCNTPSRYSVLNGLKRKNGIIHITSDMSKATISALLRDILDFKTQEPKNPREWRPYRELTELEESFLEKMTAIMYSRLLIERTLAMKDII